jgi:DNA topoisomerase-3
VLRAVVPPTAGGKAGRRGQPRKAGGASTSGPDGAGVPARRSNAPQDERRRKRGRKVNGVKTAAKRSARATEGAPSRAAVAGETLLRIPFGNKDAATALGARYRSGGWYAPPGVDLNGFRERGWL